MSLVHVWPGPGASCSIFGFVFLPSLSLHSQTQKKQNLFLINLLFHAASANDVALFIIHIIINNLHMKVSGVHRICVLQ